MTKYIRTLTVLTDAEIQQKEVPLFRGAVLNCLGDKANILFHNHLEENKYRYSYPLIQYKRIHGKAAIVCLSQGTEDIGEFFSAKLSPLKIGDKTIETKIEQILPQQHRVQIWEQMFPYRINRWLPLNSKNYETYHQIEGMTERIGFLEHILTGNILSFAKGLGITFEKDVKCMITDCTESHSVNIKGVTMQCFDVQFKCNVSIPNYIGLGKHASINFGVVTQIKKEKNEQ